eukprot:TRINITY_DN9571_c0_g2_i1.p1 TRINITY_DN9571_c0_g2~~TRINITY_DN9571_c0_g2_i1.p1  ORF type:complete len:2499 (+),score=932.45 TRINITY_DN9571_c0_g2_i1:909-7499(+)
MELLGVLCVCNGQAVPKNQGMVLSALRTNDVLVMDIIVNADGEVFVQIPAETRVRGTMHAATMSVRASSPNRKRRKAQSLLMSDAAKPEVLRHGGWSSLWEFCTCGSMLVQYFSAMMYTLGNLCIANPTALLDAQKWFPAEVLGALLGEDSRYWNINATPKEHGILYDIQAKALVLAIHSHIVPLHPEPPQDPSRLVIAWHDIGSTFARPAWKRDPLTASLKAAGAAFLRKNTALVYSRKQLNRLITAFLEFWQHVILRNLFSGDELDNVLSSIAELLDGSTDHLDDDGELVQLAVQRQRAAAERARKRDKTAQAQQKKFHGLRSDNEDVQIAMQTKVHAVTVFERKFEHQAVEAIAAVMRAFHSQMEGLERTSSGGESFNELEKQLPDGFENQFEDPIKDACSEEAFRRQNEKLIPICLDLASYDHAVLSRTALTFNFQSMWFGKAIAQYLNEAQILFNAESWVLFKDLTQKKKRLASYLLTITQGNERTSADSQEEVACRAIIADLGATLDPKKADESMSPRTMNSSTELPKSPFTPRSGSGRGRRGSMMMSMSRMAGLMSMSSDSEGNNAEIPERQDICRNLGLHELIAQQILKLPLTHQNASRKDGRWELISLSYRFLRLFCENHSSNTIAMAPLVIPHLLEHLDLNVGAGEMGLKLFCEPRIASQLPADTIKGFVTKAVARCSPNEQHTASVPATDLLKLLLVENEQEGRGISRNQRMCMDFLLEKVGSLKIQEHITYAVQRVNKSSEKKKGSDDGGRTKRSAGNEPLRNRCKILELLALCCQGRNTATAVGAQAILPLRSLLNLIVQVLEPVLERLEHGYVDSLSFSIAPPEYLVSTLLQFLNNVYLEEGDDDDNDESNVSFVNFAGSHQDKKFQEWANNEKWWDTMVCFAKLMRGGVQRIEGLEQERSMSSSDMRSQSDSFKRRTSGCLLSPNGSAPIDVNESTKDDTDMIRSLIFKHVLRCGETFLTRKFWDTVTYKQSHRLFEPVYQLFDCVLQLTSDDTLPRLARDEVASLSTFCNKMSLAAILNFVKQHCRAREKRQNPLDRSDGTASLPPGTRCIVERFSESVVKIHEVKHAQEEKAAASAPRQWEAFVYDRFCQVQMHLAEAFTEDTESLNILLTRLRREMAKLPEHAPTNANANVHNALTAAPPWLTALVHHLVDDPNLPDQVICGSLKIFTKLIITATLPIEELADECEDEIENLEPAHVAMQNKLNRLGLTSVMVKLSERGVNGSQSSVANDAIAFGIAMLHGGNKRVQDAMLDFFLENDECFFESMKDAITMASEKLQVDTDGREQELDLDSITQVLRLLQLCSEGHHFKMQNYIRHQEDNLRSSNVVREVLLFLRTLICHEGLITGPQIDARNAAASDYMTEQRSALLDLAGQTFETLTEFCQGPCPENQNEVVGCNICHLVDLILQSRDVALLELKSKAISTLLSVLEGCSSGSGGGAKVPPTVSMMLRHKLIDNIQNTISHIWDELKAREDKAGAVFVQIDNEFRSGHEGDADPFRQARENKLIDDACEVLDVVQSVEESGENDDANEGASLSDLLDVSFNLYILLMTLSNYSADIEQRLEKLPGKQYFKKMVGTIEIARGSALEKVYFRIPATCSGLSKPTKLAVLWDLRDKESRAAKLGGFFELSTELIAEMKYLHNIRREVQEAHYNSQSRFSLSYTLGQFFTSTASQDKIRSVNVLAALLVNTLLLLTYSVFEYDVETMKFEAVEASDDVNARLGQGLVYLMPSMFDAGQGTLWDDLIQWIILVSCMVNLVFSGADIYFWWKMRLRRVYVELMKKKKARDADRPPPKASKAFFGLRNSWAVKAWQHAYGLYAHVPRGVMMGLYWRTALVVISLAALFYSPFFTALHLLSVIPQSSHLRNVVSAVSLNGQTLLMTFAFGVLVIYLFSIVGYIAFYQDFIGDAGLEKPNCVTLLQCFTFTLMNGMRSGGGVGDILSVTPLLEGAHHTERLIFDYFFFVGVTVILLGIVSGIITDSFTELRKRKDDFEEEMRNYCFICGIETSKFERYLKGGMARHTRKEHNMWNYLYFHHHLLTKKEDEFTGQESFVSERIRDRDFSFYPINRSMSMLELGVLEDEDGDDLNEEIRGEMSALQKRVADAEAAMQEMSRKLTQNHIETEHTLAHVASQLSMATSAAQSPTAGMAERKTSNVSFGAGGARSRVDRPSSPHLRNGAH